MNKSRAVSFLSFLCIISILCFFLPMTVYAADGETYKIYNSLVISTGAAKNGYSIEVPRTAYKSSSLYVCFQSGSSSWSITGMGVTATQVYNSGTYYVFKFNSDIISKTPTRPDNLTVTFKGSSWLTLYGIYAYPDTTQVQLSSGIGYNRSGSIGQPSSLSYTSISAGTISTSACITLRVAASSLIPCDTLTIPFYITSNAETGVSVTSVTVYHNNQALTDSVATIWSDQDITAPIATTSQVVCTISNPKLSGYYYVQIAFDYKYSGSSEYAVFGLNPCYMTITNLPNTDDYVSWMYRDIHEISEDVNQIGEDVKESKGFLGSIKDKLISIFNELVKGSPAADDLNQSVDDKAQDLQNLNDNLNNYSRPDTDSLNVDINGIISASNINSAGSLLSVVLSNNIFVQVLLLAFIFALAAYVFFGKRG